MYRITIGNEELDLYQTDDINFNIQLNTIGNVSNRNSSYSNTIEIPKTSKNQRILGFAGSMGNMSRVPYEQKRCTLSFNTITIVSSGFLRLLGVGPESYSIFINDGIVDLEVLLSDSTISELGYSEYDHLLGTPTDVINTFDNTYEDGYIYAVAEFGKLIGSTITVEKLAPSVFAKTILLRIFESRGLRLEGDFIDNNTDFEQLVIPPTRGIDIEDVALTSTNAGSGSGAVLDVDQPQDDFEPIPFVTTYPITTNNYNTDIDIISGGRLEFNRAGLVELNLDIDYGITDGRVQIMVSVGNSTILIRELSGSSLQESILFTTEVGDVLQILVIAYSSFWGASGRPRSGYFDRDFTINSLSVQINNLSGGTVIKVNDYMSSDLSQKEFVKDILQRYGLILSRNRIDPSIYELISMETLLDDTENAVDWSSKLISIDNESYDSGYAQQNRADYNYTKDTVPFMQGFLNITNVNLETERTIINGIYQIPDSYVRPGALVLPGTTTPIPVYSFPIWEIISDPNGDTIENTEAKISIMRIRSNSQSTSYTRFDSNPQSSTNNKYLSLQNMSYQYFFDTYYSNFKKLLNSYKEVDVSLKLNLVDFRNIDMSKLVYLRQTGRYYYIDTVKLGRNSSAKLIETRNFR